MAHGYYRGGSAGETGYYYFNGSNLETRSMISAGSDLPRTDSRAPFSSVLGEGKPATLYTGVDQHERLCRGMGQLRGFFAKVGMLDDPYDHYGWLLSNAYISVRLVLDTGLNHGWGPRRPLAIC